MGHVWAGISKTRAERIGAEFATVYAPDLNRALILLGSIWMWGVAVPVLLALIGMTMFWSVSWISSGGVVIALSDGSVGAGVIRGPMFISPGWMMTKSEGWPEFLPKWQNGASGVFAFVPLWIPMVFCGGVAARIWRRKGLEAERVRAGKCRDCGYERKGLDVSAACPECGVVCSTQRQE